MSAGYTHCLTAVKSFTRWPEAVPIPDIIADTVARTLLTGWISRFGCSQTITADQECQFESQLFCSLTNYVASSSLGQLPITPQLTDWWRASTGR
jgi:hypothetical protein